MNDAIKQALLERGFRSEVKKTEEILTVAIRELDTLATDLIESVPEIDDSDVVKAAEAKIDTLLAEQPDVVRYVVLLRMGAKGADLARRALRAGLGLSVDEGVRLRRRPDLAGAADLLRQIIRGETPYIYLAQRALAKILPESPKESG